MPETDLIDGFSFVKKVIRCIHMRSVMGAHFQRCYIADSAIVDFHEINFLRGGIPGINCASEYFLRDINNLHITDSLLSLILFLRFIHASLLIIIE